MCLSLFCLLRNKKHVETRFPPSVRQPDSQMNVEQLYNLKYAGSGREPDNKHTWHLHHRVIDSNKNSDMILTSQSSGCVVSDTQLL